jgi:hypothetical protein
LISDQAKPKLLGVEGQRAVVRGAIRLLRHYVVLWTKLYRSEQRYVAVSLPQLGELAGLSQRNSAFVSVLERQPSKR